MSWIWGQSEKFSKIIDPDQNIFPVKVKRNVDFQTIAWYEENFEHLPGVSYIVELQRDYSFGVGGAHMFGYNKEVTANQLKLQQDIYDFGDYVGSNGLEKFYEKYLRGEKGFKYLMVDARQKTIGPYLTGNNDQKPKKGYDLRLTIDIELQELAEKLIGSNKGSIVAMDPVTGGILAFVSSPSYDLTYFGKATPSEILRKLNSDPGNPLFNRASMSVYSPGSIFKMVSAVAALEEGKIDENYSITCRGGLQFGNRFFKCTHSHGTVNVIRAIEKSCNTFFYSLILRIGLEKWSQYARRFGFGQITGVDIGEEAKGIVPDKTYFDNKYGKGKWGDGYLLSLGIGQGELGGTTLQIAQYMSLLATSGNSGKPHFVMEILNPDFDNIKNTVAPRINLGISQHTFDLVREGMYRVINGEGTARHIRQADIKISGKTGTVQNPHGKDHALFAGYAPSDKPKIAVAVMIENVGFGGTHAAPVAVELIKKYLKNDLHGEIASRQ